MEGVVKIINLGYFDQAMGKKNKKNKKTDSVKLDEMNLNGLMHLTSFIAEV